MPFDQNLEESARHLEASGDYRVLRRLQPISRYHPDTEEEKLLGVFVDIETTGLGDPKGTLLSSQLAISFFQTSFHRPPPTTYPRQISTSIFDKQHLLCKIHNPLQQAAEKPAGNRGTPLFFKKGELQLNQV